MAIAETKKNSPVASAENNKRLPKYEKDFGNEEAEMMIVDILRSKGVVVEKIERGTKSEDCVEKVDFWIKFYGIAEPLGIQLTISDNEDKIQDKIDALRKKNWIATKEERKDGEIDWVGKANVVLLRIKKETMIRLWREGMEKRVDISKITGDEFIGGIYRQIFSQLKEADPLKSEILMKAFENIQQKSQKKEDRK